MENNSHPINASDAKAKGKKEEEKRNWSVRRHHPNNTNHILHTPHCQTRRRAMVRREIGPCALVGCWWTASPFFIFGRCRHGNNKAGTYVHIVVVLNNQTATLLGHFVSSISERTVIIIIQHIIIIVAGMRRLSSPPRSAAACVCAFCVCRHFPVSIYAFAL